MQEIYINIISVEIIDGFIFIIFRNIIDEQRKQAENQRATPRGGQQPLAININAGGNGFFSPYAKIILEDFEQINGRLKTIKLDRIGPPVHFLNASAPPMWGIQNKIKERFYTKL